jgi:hypothetical protein
MHAVCFDGRHDPSERSEISDGCAAAKCQELGELSPVCERRREKQLAPTHTDAHALRCNNAKAQMNLDTDQGGLEESESQRSRQPAKPPTSSAPRSPATSSAGRPRMRQRASCSPKECCSSRREHSPDEASCLCRKTLSSCLFLGSPSGQRLIPASA